MNAKGLGTLMTYWLDTRSKRDSMMGFDDNSSRDSKDLTTRGENIKTYEEAKYERLIDWMTEVFSSYVKKIVSI